MARSEETPDLVLSLDEVGDAKIRSSIATVALAAGVSDRNDDSPPPLVHIRGVRGQHHALMAIRSAVRLHVLGPLGDYALSYCGRCDVRVDGDGGQGVAECLEGAAVRFHGNVGDGAGVGLRSGTLAVYGSAGDRVGAAMCAGEVFIRGNVGSDAGVGMRGGTLVVGGDAGPRLGEHQGVGTIFLRGRAESLAEGMVEVKLRKRDELLLGVLLLNASLRGAAKDFRRVIPELTWQREQSLHSGEVRPSWR